MVEVRSLTDTFHLESGLPERPLYQRYQEVDLSCRGRGAGESRLQVNRSTSPQAINAAQPARAKCCAVGRDPTMDAIWRSSQRSS